ncbi:MULTISPECIES: nitroreductase family protein [Enterococcus]|uniref:nitroreductase family protein n=1 Tax=Enterococcus TaxID=1350 RepID=UPI00215C35B7|nr:MULTISPECIES: nitroreductase family protein [Enterococcus]MCR9046989.1 nitroreductase family protein [Enterococcus faecium]MDQ8605309.1 nitroreductase family protein [Enterococcus sp. FR202]MDQ8614369.1 nitroreductase family protein [Enterococcus sp. FR165]MDQ8627029.1 nitroreductase family protein [Enterococcus sp. FR204]MDQ8646074.1 nitroreductase family protein [Enterococcus sp. FR208]
MTTFTDTLKNRRSIYHLGRNVSLSNEELTTLIKEAIKESPTAFNAQSTRAVILFGDAHEKLWEITEEALRPLTPAEAFPNTQNKLAGFKNGYGTVLFFKDTDVVKGLQEQFELYADNFPDWSEQSNGIATANTWVALVDKGLGANLQHYNPVIDEAVVKEWNIPSNWKLRSQLVFGSPETPAGEKEYMNDADRFRVFG